jgi:hypothetical protein
MQQRLVTWRPSTNDVWLMLLRGAGLFWAGHLLCRPFAQNISIYREKGCAGLPLDDDLTQN